MTGCLDTPRERVRDRLRGRPVALLSATEEEAAPILAALTEVEKLAVATKAFYTGELDARSVGPGSVGTLGSVDRGAADSVGVVLVVTGCDKTNTAHALTCLLEIMRPLPRLVMQTGIAGAFVTGPLAPAPAVGDIVLAEREAYADTGSSSPEGWLSAATLGLPIFAPDGIERGAEFPLDAALVGAAKRVIEALDWSGIEVAGMGGAAGGAGAAGPPAIWVGPCVTSSRVTGLSIEAETLSARWGALAESMEGAAAAHVCALYAVPFLEIRGVSNLIVDRDRSSWQVERAVAVAGRAAVAVVAALDRLPL